MVDDEDARKDRLFEDAVRAFHAHYAMDETGRARQPDRQSSRIQIGAEPTVVLMDPKGVPLGTVIWSADSQATFEPPTRITVVDHFQGLRPKR